MLPLAETFDPHSMRDRIALLDRKATTTAADYTRILQRYLAGGWSPSRLSDLLKLQHAAMAARRCACSVGDARWQSFWPDMRSGLAQLGIPGAAPAGGADASRNIVVLVSNVDGGSGGPEPQDAGTGSAPVPGVRATCACCGRAAVVRGNGTFTEVGRGAAMLVELHHRLSLTEAVHGCDVGAGQRTSGPMVFWLDPPALRSCEERRAALGPENSGLRLRSLQLAMTRCHGVMRGLLEQFAEELERVP